MAARAGYDGPRGAAYIWIKDIHIDFRTSASVLAPNVRTNHAVPHSSLFYK